MPEFTDATDHQIHLAAAAETVRLINEAKQVERRSHVEYPPRPRLSVWWDTILYALVHRLGRYLDARNNDDIAKRIYEPTRALPVVVYDETPDEYLERLKQLAKIGSQRIEVHENNDLDDGQGIVFADRPKWLHAPLHGYFGPPSVASVILDEPTP